MLINRRYCLPRIQDCPAWQQPRWYSSCGSLQAAGHVLDVLALCVITEHKLVQSGFMPARKQASFALLCLAALILLCSVPLLLRAPPKEVAQPLRGIAEADAVNWELLDRVLSTQPPKDPRFRSQLGQDEWVSRAPDALQCMRIVHACSIRMPVVHVMVNTCAFAWHSAATQNMMCMV